MSNPSRDEALFLQLVAMFQYAAMQQMGKLPSPMTGKIERDLAQARASIDMIEMLQRRTQAQRSPRETELLDKVLFELRMNFVDESQRPAERAEPAEPAAGEVPDDSHPGQEPGGA
jgi:hypothetical protein